MIHDGMMFKSKSANVCGRRMYEGARNGIDNDRQEKREMTN